MKKFAQKIIMPVLTILFIIFFLSLYGEKYLPDRANTESHVSWTEVNLREKPSTSSEIITSLAEGTTVVETGKIYDYLDGVYAVWVEVSVGNHTGWVVAESLGQRS